MQELDECLEMRRKIDEIDEKIQMLRAEAFAPKNQIISDLPRGSNMNGNAIEKFLERQEKLNCVRSDLCACLDTQWRIIEEMFSKCGVICEDKELMKLRFYYGLPWKKCAARMKATHGEHWNNNRVYRTYRSVLFKCTKK